MNYKSYIFIIAIVCMSVLKAAAFIKQNNQTGGLAGEYLSYFSVNARAHGMGDAYTAVANEASGIYYNPAAPAGQGYQQMEAMYTPLLGGGDYMSMHYSNAINETTSLGMSIIAYDSSEAQKRNIWGEYLGTFKESSSSLIINASRVYSDFSGGINLKLVSQKVDTYMDTGLGADLGFKFSASHKLDLAMAVQNILPPRILLDTEEDVYPLNLSLGAALSSYGDKLLTSLDISFWDPMEQTTLRWAMGAEYRLFEMIELRTGINYKNVSVGIGLDTERIGFSYAARYSSLGLNHLVSTSYRFGYHIGARELALQKKEEKFRMRQKEFDKKTAKYQKNINKKLKKSYDAMQKERDSIGEKEEELQTLIEAAVGIKLGDYKAAEKKINQILATNPDNKDARLMLNVIHDELSSSFSFNKLMKAYETQDYKGVLEEYAKALKTDPQYNQATIIALLSSARQNILEGSYVSASDDLKEVIRLKPDNSVAKVLLEKVKRLKKIKDEME